MSDMSVRRVRSALSEGEPLISGHAMTYLKIFYSDVMTRHTALHGQAVISMNKPRKSSW